MTGRRNRLIGYAAGAFLLALAFAGEGRFGLMAAFSGPVLAVLFEALAIYCLYQLARGDLKLRGRVWPAYRIGTAESPGYDCRLRLLDDAVSIEPAAEAGQAAVRLPHQKISGVSVDGECLRIACSGDTVVLQPGGADVVSSARTRLSEALRAEISLRIGPPR